MTRRLVQVFSAEDATLSRLLLEDLASDALVETLKFRVAVAQGVE